MSSRTTIERNAVGRHLGAMTLVLGALLFLPGGCDGESIRRNSKLSRSYYLLGRDYLAKKQAGLAKSELIKAIKYDPDNAEAHRLLGVIFFLEGVKAANFIDRDHCIKGAAARDQLMEANKNFRQARDHLTKVVNLGKKKKKIESEALNYLANIAIHFKRYDVAITVAGTALENILYRNRFLSLGTRGQAYFKKGDLDKAARDLRQSLFHQPRFCVGRYWLAKVYYARKRYELAEEELKKVISNSKCPLQDAYQLLGLCYLKQRKSEEARDVFQKCVARNPKSCLSEECRRYARLI